MPYPDGMKTNILYGPNLEAAEDAKYFEAERAVAADLKQATRLKNAAAVLAHEMRNAAWDKAPPDIEEVWIDGLAFVEILATFNTDKFARERIEELVESER